MSKNTYHRLQNGAIIQHSRNENESSKQIRKGKQKCWLENGFGYVVFLLPKLRLFGAVDVALSIIHMLLENY